MRPDIASHFRLGLVRLSLWMVLGISACAHQTASQPGPSVGSSPAQTTYPSAATGAAPEAGAPADATAATEATAPTEAPTDITEPTPPMPERPSPPPLGLESLTDLPEAANPARGASLELAQEGRRAWMNNDPADARQKLQSALQIWGNNPYAHYYLGMLELEAGHYAQGAAFAKSAARSLRQNPFWNARAYLLLSETLERSGNRQGALEAKIKAFDLDPRVELR